MFNVRDSRLERDSQSKTLADESGLRESPSASAAAEGGAFPLVSERKPETEQAADSARLDEDVWFDALPESEGSIAPISFDEPPLRVRRKAPRRIAQAVIALAACAAGLVFVAEYDTVKEGVSGLFGNGVSESSEGSVESVALSLSQTVESRPASKAPPVSKAAFSPDEAADRGTPSGAETEVAAQLPSSGPPSTESPSSGLPSTGLPSTGLPSTGLPSTGLPSSGATSTPSPQQPSQAQPVAAAKTEARAAGARPAQPASAVARAADARRSDSSDSAEQPEAVAKASEAEGEADPGQTFDASAANKALARAARLASMCGREGGPNGGGTVRVVYNPEGGTRATVLTPAFAGTEVGRCVESAFGSASTPPYRGGGLSSTYPFTVPY